MNFMNKKQFPRLETVPIFYQEVISSYCKSSIPEKNIYKRICMKIVFVEIDNIYVMISLDSVNPLLMLVIY